MGLFPPSRFDRVQGFAVDGDNLALVVEGRTIRLPRALVEQALRAAPAERDAWETSLAT
ncbi:hypothetical protein [Rhodospirillum rubrum]|uniref:hypothetical protein n=1 Tax=Rhodospirillum rubrum TaxID=1085 RepID=UPI000229D3E1|nr:hypothetical protein [Rhodospirillum rubrum]AEO49747.1 hypothetical protein F11_16425 [Rhodospirillum rubrum F11]QXG79945.1 hypothetical protein KUL73_16530 [Rhodospirillum rubrum]